jgi:formate hydrogenlyase subunit 3/multisubunit Na+/H+ antiporter MnhD subunit
MFILLTIFLFLFATFAMLILRVVRPKLNIQGFVAALAVLSGLPMVFLARSDISRVISLLQWKPEFLFPTSPSLLIDDISWYFSLTLATISFSVVISSIAQLGQSAKPNLSLAKQIIQVDESSDTIGEVISPATPVKNIDGDSSPMWSFWAAILILTSLGLLAVTSGNMLTLLLAWAALDIFELIILLNHTAQSKTRERVILVFSAKLAGLVTMLITGLVLWSQGNSLSFDAITQSTGVLIILATGLRLGVLPLQLPFTQGLPIRRGLVTALRLVPAASSYILLVRVSNTGVTGVITPYLLGLASLAGLYAAVNWLLVKDEMEGRTFWIIGTASLAIAAAILKHPSACLAWSIASLLSGGLIFCFSLRHRNLFPLVFLAIFCLSSLPFSPTWQSMALYQYSSTSSINLTLFSVFSFMFLLIQSFLLAGFIHHSLRGIYHSEKETYEHIEKWVWLLFPFALVILVIIHLFIGWIIYPNLSELPLSGWIVGPINLIFAVLILYITRRYPRLYPQLNSATKSSYWNNLLSFDWLYSFLWKSFRSISKLFSLFSTLLEGDGGILWALVLFALIFVFLQR